VDKVLKNAVTGASHVLID